MTGTDFLQREDNFPLYTYSALADFRSKGGMWRIIYWVSPRTPHGGEAGKSDKLPSLHRHSCRWLSSKEKCGNQREAIGGGERLKRGEPKTKRAILTLAKFQTLPKY